MGSEALGFLTKEIRSRARPPLAWLRDQLPERLPRRVGPTISYFEPLEGQPGCTVTLFGSEFAADRLENQVEIGGHECFLISASPTELHVIAPSDVETGKVQVNVEEGTATGPQDFTVLGYPSGASGDDGPPILFEGDGDGGAGDVNPIGTVRVLVVLVTPNDKSPANPGAARDAIVDTWTNVREYYRQASYDRTTIQFDVTNAWEELDGSLADFLNDKNDNFDDGQLQRLIAQAAQAAVNDGMGLGNYQMLAVTMFADGKFLRATAPAAQQNFSYNNALPPGNPDRMDINLTAGHSVNLLAIGEAANWGRAAHEFGHNVVSAPTFYGDGTATLGEDVYGSDLIDPDAATAADFDLMGRTSQHALFTGYHMEKLKYYSAANILELSWDRNPFSDEFDIVAHGLSEDGTKGRVHLIKIKVAAGLSYFVQVRQRPGPTTQIFDDSIPLNGASNQGGVIVTSVISDTLNTNQQTRFITLLHEPSVLSQGEFAEDPARALRISVVNDDVQTRPLVCRVRVEWAQTISDDPKGAFDLNIQPWDQAYQTPDIWVDRDPFGTYDTALDSQGRPYGSGDKPKVGAVNNLHARIHVSGATGAQNVHVSYYAVTPPGVGDNGNWAPIGSQVLPSIPKNGFIDAPPMKWTPVVGKHTCLMVHASHQLGEISGGNNAAQENIASFVAAGSSPVEPVVAQTAIRNPLDERRMVHVDIRGVPRGWRVQFPHAWVWLEGKEERQLDLIIVPFHDLSAYEGRELPKDAEIKIRGNLQRDYEELEPGTEEQPGSRYYPIGGVLNDVHVRRRSTIRLMHEQEGEPDEWTIALYGRISPEQKYQRIRIELLDPRGKRRVHETTTGEEGNFSTRFDLRYAPSLQADPELWEEAEGLEKGTYRARAEIFNAPMAADAASNFVFIER